MSAIKRMSLFLTFKKLIESILKEHLSTDSEKKKFGSAAPPITEIKLDGFKDSGLIPPDEKYESYLNQIQTTEEPSKLEWFKGFFRIK